MKRKITILDLLVILFSVTTLISLTSELLFNLDNELIKLIKIIDSIACVVFLADWYQRFKESENKFRFFILNLLDLIASLPYYIIPYVGYMKSIRLLKLLRVLKAFRSVKLLLSYLKENSHYSMKMMFVIILSIMIIAGSSSILIAESNDPNANIKTSEDALWWSFVTLATVGYGDYYPVTTAGRIIAVVMSLGGIGLFGAFTGTLMTYFINDNKDEKKDNNS